MKLTVKDLRTETSEATKTTKYTMLLQLVSTPENNQSQGQLLIQGTSAFAGITIGQEIDLVLPVAG